jgi:phosphatidyl-myo-inositol alpha-mannosyltransferase
VRVALVCPYDWAKPGGVQAHVASLATHLRQEHAVRIIAPASDPPGSGVQAAGRPVGIPFNASVAPAAPAPTAARRVLRALAAFEPDVVHVHEPFVPAGALAASALGPRPVVGTVPAGCGRWVL